MENNNECSDEDNLILTLNIVHIIKLWCNNVNYYVSKNDGKIPRHIYDDYIEFEKMKDKMQIFLEKFCVYFRLINIENAGGRKCI